MQGGGWGGDGRDTHLDRDGDRNVAQPRERGVEAAHRQRLGIHLQSSNQTKITNKVAAQ